MSRYVKTFKVKDGDKYKNSNLMPFHHIDDENLLEKNKTIWIKIEDLKNNELNALPVYNDRYIKPKIRTYSNKVYTTFGSLNVSEDDIECESFTVISIDYLLFNENKYYLRVYLDNCAYKIVDKQMIDYFDNNLFETDEDWVLYILYYDRIDLSKGIDATKSNNSKDCVIYHYCCCFNHGSKSQDSVCNGFDDLAKLRLNLNDIAIIIVKAVDYRCLIHDISKSAAIHLLKNSVLDDHGYI